MSEFTSLWEPFRAAFAEAAIGMAITDLDGHFLEVNPTLCRAVEYEREELLHTNAFAITHPGDRARMGGLIGDMLSGEIPSFVMEKRCLKKSGGHGWLRTSVSPIRDSQGRPVRIAILAEEITDRKRIEQEMEQAHEALRQREAELRSITDNVPVMVSSIDAEGRFRRVNRVYEIVFGRPAESVVGKTLREVGGEPHASIAEPYVARVLAGEAVRFESRIVNHRGELRDINVAYTPQFGAAGKVIGYIAMVEDITERKAFESERTRLTTQLLVERAHLRAVLDQMPAAVLIADAASGETLLANRLVEEIFGRAAVDAVLLGDIDHPLARAIRTGEVVRNQEVLFRRQDDRLGVLSVSAAPIRDRDGKITAGAAVIQDVSANREAEAALQESEKRFRSFFDLAAVGMTQSLIPSGRFIAVNQKFADIIGYTREELLEKSYADLTHPGDREANLLLYRQLMDNEIPEFSTEKRYCRKTGEAVWVQTTVSAVRDVNRMPLYTVAVVEEITERKEAEQALRESEERFRTLAESLPQLVWTCLPNGQCDYLSRQWVAYTGVREEYQLGLEWLPQVIYPDDRRRTLEAWMNAVADKAPYDIEYRIRRFDGAYRWFKTRGTPLRDSQGRILRWFGTCTDIEDQRRTTEALRRSNEELRRANEDLNQFAFSASHDLKEPLRMITIYAQLLQRKYRSTLDSQAHEYIEQAVSGAKRMEMLVNDLLEYTQIVNVPLADTAPVAIEVAVRKATSNLETAIEESGAGIDAGPLPSVAVREVHLLQLFQNLISNALKYRSAEPPRIQITAERLDHTWRICVRDNGIGIDPAYHLQIFRIFRRLHANLDYPGTGIGLAICQKIVERYGGKIWVESDGENKGSAFWFTLPAEPTSSLAGANL
ncbi:MAG TPA: PAS domain S-box protein [Bryobacteraceae bacterium]|nr:PAS domain S-box protein [Bryobacteraceae bacterium]